MTDTDHEDIWLHYKPIDTDKPLFISFNNRAAEEINKLPYNQLLTIVVNIKNPTQDGLPTDEELRHFYEIEETLNNYIGRENSIPVGIMTSNGLRYFYYYGIFEDRNIESFIEQLCEDFNYNVRYLLEKDPNKDTYWRLLYPSENEWQLVTNQLLLKDLHDHEDDLTIPRKIDHWVYFKDPNHRHSFSLWASSHGFEIYEYEDEDRYSDDYCIKLFQIEAPTDDYMDRVILLLQNAAQEYKGEYDGYETEILSYKNNKIQNYEPSKDS